MEDIENTVNNLEICRLCLNMTTAKVNIFTEDFPKMIEILTSLKVTEDDNFPKISCLKCARDVKTAFLIRRRIIQSYKTFNNNLESDDNQNKSTSNNNQISNTSDLPLSESNKSSDMLKIISNENTTETPIKTTDSSENINKDIIDEQLIVDEERNNILKSNEMDLMKKLNPFLKPPDGARLSDEQFMNIQSLRLKINSKYINHLKAVYANRNKNVDAISQPSRSNSGITTSKRSTKVHRSKESKTGNKTKRPAPQKKSKVPVKRRKKEISTTYCKECDIKFDTIEECKTHMTTHKSKMCPICNKMITVNYLKKHISLHEASPMVCDQCGKSCKNPANLRDHIRYFHRGGSVCDLCGKVFRAKTKMMSHRRKNHIKERNHKCETCGQTFFFKRYLERHIQTRHMKLRPHICEYCGKAYSCEHAIRTHLRQHTNEAPFPCNICNERFRQKVSLRGHMKNRHGIEEENKVFCEHCGKGFASTVALDVHVRLHLLIKCKWCADMFVEQKYLDQHVQSVHANMVDEEGRESEENN